MKRLHGSLLPALLLAIVGVAVAATVLLGRSQPHSALPALTSGADAHAARPVDREPARVALDGYPAGTVVAPAERILAEHWGRDWERVKHEYEKKDFDTSREFVVFPWPDASPHLEAEYRRAAQLHCDAWANGLLRWPDAADIPEWVKTKLRIERELTPRDLEVVASIASEHNPLIAALAEDCAGKLRAEVEKRWNQGRYEKCPIASYGIPRRTGAFYSTSVASHGWTISMDLFHEECADLNELKDEIKHLRQERDAAIREYLAW